MKEKRELLRFNVDIVKHCNLNCVGCGHFSPLAKKEFLDPTEFETDCRRLNVLTGGKIERLELMGGEPLLHPHLLDIMRIARKYFIGQINICTNGILVAEMSEDFFNACNELDIAIAITLYPINLNWYKIEKLINKHKVNLIKVSTKNHNSRIWFKNHRDLTGSQDIEKNFKICRWGNNCIILEHGRLATCVMPFKTAYYNQYYQVDTFKIPESDSINIYEAKDISEILEFLSKPISACRYCLPDKDEIIEWKVSNKQIEEWS